MTTKTRAKRPMRPCLECGRLTTAKSQVCRFDQRPAKVEDAEATYEHRLTGGRWVTIKCVRRWVPDKPPADDTAA